MATGWIRAARIHFSPHVSKRSPPSARTVVTGDPLETPFFSSWQPYIRVANIGITTVATYYLVIHYDFGPQEHCFSPVCLVQMSWLNVCCLKYKH